MRFFFLASTQRSPHSAYSAAPFSRSCFAPLNADTRSKAAPLCVTGRVCRSRCRVLRNVYGLGCVHRAVDSARAGSAIALCCREFLFCSAHAGKEQRKRRDANSSGAQTRARNHWKKACTAHVSPRLSPRCAFPGSSYSVIDTAVFLMQLRRCPLPQGERGRGRKASVVARILQGAPCFRESRRL